MQFKNDCLLRQKVVSSLQPFYSVKTLATLLVTDDTKKFKAVNWL